MKFGIKKYVMLIMKKRRREAMKGIELPNHKNIRTLREKRKLQILDKLKWKKNEKRSATEEQENCRNLIKDETVNHISECCNFRQRQDTGAGTTDWGIDPTGNCARDWNLTYWQMVYVHTRIYPRKWDVQKSLGHRNKNVSPNPSLKVRSSVN